MDLKDRFSILKQGVQIAQSKGVLSLEDAVYVKAAMDNIDNNENLDVAFKIIIKVIQFAQSKGAYTLKDAYLLYVASENIEESIREELEERDEDETNK